MGHFLQVLGALLKLCLELSDLLPRVILRSLVGLVGSDPDEILHRVLR